MNICVPISTCARSAIHIKRRIGTNCCSVISRGPSELCCYTLYRQHPKRNHVGLGVSISYPNQVSTSSGCSIQTCYRNSFPTSSSKQRSNSLSVVVDQSVRQLKPHKGPLDISYACLDSKMRFILPKQVSVAGINRTMGDFSWSSTCTFAGLICSLLVCNSSSDPAYAEAPREQGSDRDEHGRFNGKLYNGKKVYTDYSIIGIPGDGRCLFRSVAHGACIRSGKPVPGEGLQRELADNLRSKVADEFIRRREETEWFVEGDFDAYVSQIRKPHVWGGEPELFMASHVLRMPISVYMRDEKAGGLICIAEYGQDYGKDNPIRVIYHGSGHYDALQIHDKKGAKSKL